MGFYHLLAATGLVLPLLAGHPAEAARSLECIFDRECIADTPCQNRDPLPASMIETGNSWEFLLPQGDMAHFTAIRAPAERRFFVSTDLDPDADAVAMLTISEGGEALLTFHGNFPDLGVVTHTGTCLPENR